MSEIISPESRIFHVGRECYIVYLGKERDDLRPFLRIGNARNIPDEVYQAISTTVVTDDHVGNPLLETVNASRFPGRYLGDTVVVREIRKFFQSFDLPTDDVTDYRSVKDGEKRHMVWFYSSGNIHLRFDDKTIFNLRAREKEDRHYIKLYEEAKAEFLRNPLRYIRQDFNGPGVVLSDGNAFWYDGGEMMSLALRPGFSPRLMFQGIDPDLITTAVYDLEAGELQSGEAAVFVGLIKRARQKRKQLKVITDQPVIQRKLRLLFPSRGELPAALDVTDISGRRKASFRDSMISRKDNHRVIQRAGLPLVSFDGAPEAGISVDAGSSTISIAGEGRRNFYIPDGVPVDLIPGTVQGSRMVERYIGMVLGNVKEHLTEDEFQAVQALERYIRMLRDDIEAGKDSASSLIKQLFLRARDTLRRVNPEGDGPAWYLYSNVVSVLGVLRGKLRAGHPLGDNAGQMASLVQSLASRMPEPDMVLPFWGDLFTGAEPVLFWRTTKRSFVYADLVSARSVNSRIAEITRVDDSACKEDLARLLKLVRSLNAGGSGPLTAEQLALLKAPDEKPAVPEKPVRQPERKPASSSSKKTVSSAPKKEPGTEAPKAEKMPEKLNIAVSKPPARRSRSRRRLPLWLLWLLLLLLLLLIGAVAWDLSGKAPWGTVFGRDRSSSSGQVVEEGRKSGKASDAGDESGSAAAAGSTDAGVAPKGSSSSESSESGGGLPSSSGTTGTAGVKTAEADSQAADSQATDSQATDSQATDSQATDSQATDSQATDSQATAVPATDPKKVNADVAPRTKQQIRAYLDVDGRVPITEADIHLAANEIAVLNGFKDLDYRVYTGKDPDWIYPGGVLDMPDAADAYTVRRGDTIWFLAARSVRKGVEQELRAFDQAVKTLDDGSASAAMRTDALATLERIVTQSKAEAMRQKAVKALNSHGK